MNEEETISAEEKKENEDREECLKEITVSETSMRTAQIGKRSRLILVTIGKLLDVEHTFLNVASTMNYTGENADDDKFVDLTMQMNDLLLKYLALSVDNAALESDIKEI